MGQYEKRVKSITERIANALPFSEPDVKMQADSGLLDRFNPLGKVRAAVEQTGTNLAGQALGLQGRDIRQGDVGGKVAQNLGATPDQQRLAANVVEYAPMLIGGLRVPTSRAAGKGVEAAKSFGKVIVKEEPKRFLGKVPVRDIRPVDEIVKDTQRIFDQVMPEIKKAGVSDKFIKALRGDPEALEAIKSKVSGRAIQAIRENKTAIDKAQGAAKIAQKMLKNR